MPWSQHTPYRQPPDWKTTRKRIMRRDRGVCYVCRKPGANDVDHVVPHFEGGGDGDTNLAAIHRDPCHKAKTAREANRARSKRKRSTEQHPGMI